MKYKGYNISKEFYIPSLMGYEKHRWLVFKNGKNCWFNTLKEAKEYINKKI